MTRLNDQQLLRYSRQILLPAIGIEGQERLLASRVLIIGLGGLGSPVALYLAAAGVGELLLADFDCVDLSNLQRQIIHSSQDHGKLKVDSAADTLRQLNPEVKVERIAQAMAGTQLQQAVAHADLVMDCSDNFATRFAVNQICAQLHKPLISAAVIRMEGQLGVFWPGRSDSPCYRCLYPEGEEGGESCSQTGILASLPGVLGCLQATEALKLLAGLAVPIGQVVLFDALSSQWRMVRLPKDPACPICSDHAWSAPAAGASPASS